MLAYRDGRSWRDVRASDLNDAVKELVGRRYTCKDLRTWNATVLAAAALAAQATEGIPDTPRGQAKLVAAAMREVADHLGNTPAVARASYVDPRLIERFEQGHTVLPALRRLNRGRLNRGRLSRGRLSGGRLNGAAPSLTDDLSDDEGFRTAIEAAVIRLLRN